MAVLLHVALHVRLECLQIWSGLSVLCLWIREIALLVRLGADVAQSRRVCGAVTSDGGNRESDVGEEQKDP